MDLSSAKIKVNRWFIIFLVGICLGTAYEAPYIRYNFHEALIVIMGYTNTQLGVMLSVYGTLALGCYLIGGIIADRFPCRNVITISAIGTALGCVVMAFYPPYPIALAIEAFWVLTTIMLLWSPAQKVGSLLSTKNDEGKVLPMLSSFEGVGAFVSTFICITVFCRIGAEQNPNSMRYIWLIYATILFICGIMTFLIIPSKALREDGASDSAVQMEAKKNKKNMGGTLGKVLKNPATYAAGFLVLGAYMAYACLTYTQSYLVHNFGWDMSDAAIISIIRNQGVRIISGPLAALFVAIPIFKNKATRLNIVISSVCIAGFVILLILPTKLNMLATIIVLMIFLALVNFIARSQAFACAYETGIDVKYFGTLSGVVSLIGYSSDAWIYILIGHWQDTLEAPLAYNRIWYLALFGCILAAISGFCLIALRRKNSTVKSINVSSAS